MKKQVNRVQSKKMVALPLNKEEAERMHREVAFSSTSQALPKWDPIILKNQQAVQLVFPLKKGASPFAPVWKVGTPLEQENFNLLCKNKQPMQTLGRG